MARKILALLQPDLAKALKKRMEDVGLSTIQLAEELTTQEKCRVSQPTVSAILNRSNGCSIERLSNIDKIIRKRENKKKVIENRVLANG